MNKKIELQPVVEGKKMLKIPMLSKQNSLKSIEPNSLNTSVKSEQKPLPTCVPPSRRLSIKSNFRNRLGTGKTFQNKSSSCIQFYEDPPISLKKTYHNDRIYWKKRSAGNLPLLILTFEGVAGDYFKPSLWSDENPSFLIRENLFACLLALKKEYYIVLVCTYSRQITGKLLKIIDKNGNSLDAIYLQRHRKWHPRYKHDVSSILEDFRISNMNNVLAVSAVGLESTDIGERKGFDLIYDKSTSSLKKFLCYHASACDKIIPITVLVPHIRLTYRQSYFNEISTFLLRLKRINSNFFYVFEKHCEDEKLRVNLTEGETDEKEKIDECVHQFIFFKCDYTQKLKASSSEVNVRIRKISNKFINAISK